MRRALRFAAAAAVLATVACSAPAPAFQQPAAPPPAAPPHTLAGTIRYHRNFHSQFLPTDRDVIVYLPPRYDEEPNRRYPVFYMHDGQNLFDGATSFIPGQEWRVDETAETLIRAGRIEPIIVVGINNAGAQRIDEYTPTRDAGIGGGGKADLYGRLLVEELKPFVDGQYRTLPDAANTGLGGSSLGGLVSLYLGLKYPNVFGKLAVVSPSVWWDNRFIVRHVQALTAKPSLRLWVDIGLKEGQSETQSQLARRDTQLLRDALVAEGWKLKDDLKYVEAKGATHSEGAWAQRIDDILLYLYPRR